MSGTYIEHIALIDMLSACYAYGPIIHPYDGNSCSPVYQCLMILFVLLSNTHPQVPVRFNEVVAIIVSIIGKD